MKKKYSLALWGWAARWYIHIGVLKLLEEKNVQIEEIAGTSMGAIVWCLYALGKSSGEIAKIGRELKYTEIFDLDFSLWLIKGDKIIKKLEEYFWNTKLEDLQIPTKVIATNIESWERKIFTSGKVVDAVRASISLPWLIKPHEIDGINYIDGGVLNNLPIDTLKGKNIIWVSALKKVIWPIKKTKAFLWLTLKKSFFSLNYQILSRTIIAMMEKNEIHSLEVVRNNPEKILHFFRPDFWKLDYYNLDKVDEFIEMWYSQGKKVFSEL